MSDLKKSIKLFDGMKLINGKVYCPLCEENGPIFKTRLNRDKLDIYVCDECDGLWFMNNDYVLYEKEGMQNLEEYIEKQFGDLEKTYLLYFDYDWYKEQ
ncbi:hypothetical protein U472_08320 [Orenia metallireducens]|uniref:Transcription factor zinc-finger domain-containing protein n=1 Tax=Orenia metallireducens TaxID=1413210 RepID=A0A1C0A6Z1_9FIRM|nr:zf-TFIIB domain-containing protein [Orenia metallireducens]OCL26019.1 hypothetical protein U472_08320 [Orenia metallireducens]